MKASIINTAPIRYRTLWISDVHLGTRDCKAAQLNHFLKQYQAEQVYLVGDIIDGWRMQSGIYWTRDFTRVLRRLLKLSKQGTPIYYITGNHDEFLRRFANHRFDNIHVLNRAVHTTADGRRLLVIHGDQFDGVARIHHWLKWLGDKGYDLLMAMNRGFNALRERCGYGYWSLAGFLKQHIRHARRYIEEYEQGVAYACQKQGFDGVICGHIHHAASKRIGSVDYYNTGDWVESCTALAEDSEGRVHLLHFNNVSSVSPDHGETGDGDEDDSDKNDMEELWIAARGHHSLDDIPALFIPN
jgi:UDP-2,3-diacylglucosamine pyrophosphatase LpxH